MNNNTNKLIKTIKLCKICNQSFESNLCKRKCDTCEIKRRRKKNKKGNDKQTIKRRVARRKEDPEVLKKYRSVIRALTREKNSISVKHFRCINQWWLHQSDNCIQWDEMREMEQTDEMVLFEMSKHIPGAHQIMAFYEMGLFPLRLREDC